MNKQRLSLILLCAILVLGFTLRLYKFDSPVADWHSWRQVDTSAVSRNFVQEGFDILYPRFDDLSNVASTLDNPQGYRFVEFPIYNVAQAGGYVLFDFFTLEQWGRIVSIVASTVCGIFIYLLVKRHFSQTAGLFAAFFYAVIPFSIFYGRVILPDTAMIAMTLGGIYFFDRWSELESKKEKKKRGLFFVLSLVFTASALLLKPYALFFTLPLIYLSYARFGFTFFKKWQLWAFLFLAILPLACWRVWMLSYPEGIPSNLWLLNKGDIRFKGAFFYWIFAERISKLILGYWGVILLGLGHLALLKKENLRSFKQGKGYFFYSFFLSAMLYLFVIARGNVQHDYYQILIVPILAMFVGIGADALYSLSATQYYRFTGKILLVIISFFTLMFGWYHVRDYYQINNPSMLKAGKAVDELTPKDAKVIAKYEGDTTFLYYTNRQGWASYAYDMPKMIELGADFLVIVGPDESDMKFVNQYKVLRNNSDFILFDLHQKP